MQSLHHCIRHLYSNNNDFSHRKLRTSCYIYSKNPKTWKQEKWLVNIFSLKTLLIFIQIKTASFPPKPFDEFDSVTFLETYFTFKENCYGNSLIQSILVKIFAEDCLEFFKKLKASNSNSIIYIIYNSMNRVGFEPTMSRLLSDTSTIELPIQFKVIRFLNKIVVFNHFLNIHFILNFQKPHFLITLL